MHNFLPIRLVPTLLHRNTGQGKRLEDDPSSWLWNRSSPTYCVINEEVEISVRAVLDIKPDDKFRLVLHPITESHNMLGAWSFGALALKVEFHGLTGLKVVRVSYPGRAGKPCGL